jgi:hypothetical protein
LKPVEAELSTAMGAEKGTGLKPVFFFFFFFFYSCCAHLERRPPVKRFFSFQYINVRQSIELLGWRNGLRKAAI